MTDKLITHQTSRKHHTPKDPMHQINEGIPRLGRALQHLDHVLFTTENTTIVLSSNKKDQYHVTISPDGNHQCECADFKFRGVNCWHVRATLLKQTQVKMQKSGGKLPQ